MSATLLAYPRPLLAVLHDVRSAQCHECFNFRSPLCNLQSAHQPEHHFVSLLSILAVNCKLLWHASIPSVCNKKSTIPNSIPIMHLGVTVLISRINNLRRGILCFAKTEWNCKSLLVCKLLLCLKFVKNANFTKFLKFVKIRTNSFYNITNICKVFEFSQT